MEFILSILIIVTIIPLATFIAYWMLYAMFSLFAHIDERWTRKNESWRYK